MELNVLLFASWAEALGASSVSLTVPADATVADLLAAATIRAAGRSLPKPVVAVNHKYARPDTRLRSGDEIALIPPVAGG